MEAPVISKDEYLRLLISWANINSGSYNKKGLAKMLERLQEDFKALPVKLTPLSLSKNKNSPKALHAVCRPQAPIQIFLNGHMDTVYSPSSPFQTCSFIDESKLKGPGVTDMKGGLLVMLLALQAFEQLNSANQIGWEIFINPDEEIGSPHSKAFLNEAPNRHLLGLIFEPSLPDGSLVRSRMGSGNFKIIAHGKAAHAGRNFSDGINAISHLAELILQLNKLNEEFPECIVNIAQITGGCAINVVPASAEVSINIRVPNNSASSKLLSSINAIIKTFNKKNQCQFEILGNLTRPPKPLSKKTLELFKLFQTCATELNQTLSWKDTGGASDGNFLCEGGLPTLDSLGVIGEHIHSPNEFLYIDSIEKRTQLTYLFLKKLSLNQLHF